MPNGLNDQELKRAYWLLRHKKQLKLALTGTVVIIDLIVFVLLSIQVISLIRGNRDYQNSLASLANVSDSWVKFQEHFKPKDLQVVGVKKILNKDGSYDLIAEVTNPNPKIAVTSLKYKFILDGQETGILKDFIMPQEKKYLFGFGLTPSFDGAGGGGQPSLEIVETNWHRVASLQSIPRFKFSYQNLEHSFLANQPSVYQVKADILNGSVYGFWEVNLKAVLKAGGQPIAINNLVLDQFKAREARSVEMRWFGLASGASEVELIAEVNPFDESNFMPQETEIPIY